MYDQRWGDASINCHAHLLLQCRIWRRKVNTPEMSGPIPLKCLKNNARSDTVRHARLNNIGRLKVAHQTPNALAPVRRQRRSSGRSSPGRPEFLCFQCCYHFAPQGSRTRKSTRTAKAPRSRCSRYSNLPRIHIGTVARAVHGDLHKRHRDWSMLRPDPLPALLLRGLDVPKE